MQIQATLREIADADGDLVWFRATSEALDRHGTVIESAGVDVEPFLRNPVVGWGHRTIRGGDPDDVIGRVDAIERGEGFIDVGLTFADHERAQLTEKLVRSGFVNAMSVGILPKKTASKTINGQRVPVIRESELLEVSIVPVGSNPEAQKLLRSMAGADAPDEDFEMNAEEIREAVTKAVEPLTGRLDALEKTLDAPEKVPAFAGARTSEDEYNLCARWMIARSANDSTLLHEIASHDTAPDIEVRNMLAAQSYLPTQVGTQLIKLVEDRSKFLSKLGRVNGTGLSIILPRESTRMTVAVKGENVDVITGGAALDSVTLTADNYWAGERVPNRSLADSPVAVANILMNMAASSHAANFDTECVNGTNVTSGLEDIGTPSAVLQDDDEPLATLLTQITDQYFALVEQARLRATWVIGEPYAKHLSKQVDASSRPVFGVANAPPTTTIDGNGGLLFGRPVIVHSAVAADVAYFGDLSRAMITYQRAGLTGESSRDAEFNLDNTLFRFGWRYDIALVEETQVEEFPAI